MYNSNRRKPLSDTLDRHNSQLQDNETPLAKFKTKIALALKNEVDIKVCLTREQETLLLNVIRIKAMEIIRAIANGHCGELRDLNDINKLCREKANEMKEDIEKFRSDCRRCVNKECEQREA